MTRIAPANKFLLFVSSIAEISFRAFRRIQGQKRNKAAAFMKQFPTRPKTKTISPADLEDVFAESATVKKPGFEDQGNP
jgi:hypothetical protein